MPLFSSFNNIKLVKMCMPVLTTFDFLEELIDVKHRVDTEFLYTFFPRHTSAAFQIALVQMLVSENLVKVTILFVEPPLFGGSSCFTSLIS